MTMASAASSFVIGGIRVNFPLKPYPCQVAMIGQIIKGLNRCENCLLESPTGTGKSLALLCSTLGWQAAEEERVQKYNSLLDQGITDPDVLNSVYGSVSGSGTSSWHSSSYVSERVPNLNMSTQNSINSPNGRARDTVAPLNSTSDTMTPLNSARDTMPPLNQSDASLEGGFLRDPENADGGDADFRDELSRFRTPAGSENVSSENWQNIDWTTDIGFEVPNGNATSHLRKKRTPKIFFGTRTHKQIFQIIRELRKTDYKNVRAVVLGSRDHTCIHPVVSKSKAKNEGCKTLLEAKDGEFCTFYHGVNRMKTHDQLFNLGYSNVCDLEDVVKIGKKLKACPYYATRHLMETSQIIFCPYNYLIDPLIRESMSIDLRKNILVLDEAHNVEDSCRDAASFSLTLDSLLDAKRDLEKLGHTYGIKTESCDPLIKLLSNLGLWMETNKDNLTDYTEFGKTGKIFTGNEMLNHLSHLDVQSKDLSKLEGCLNKLNEDIDGDKESYKPAAATSQLLSGFFLMLRYLFKGDMKHVNDYKVALVRMQTYSSKRAAKTVDRWIGRKSGSANDFVYSLNFWCLNPGVSFGDLGIMTRSIILTSGTLSPMGSFESELNVKFPIKYEGNHVINREQVWVGSVSKGPTNFVLNATYKHSETFAFQDELGKLLFTICESIPRGVLCFLPSYAMLDKLIDRWQRSSVWEQIERLKVPITEPRNSEDFEKSMKLFYSTIERTKDYGEGEVNGALFIAVCRGKVSEGLDFTDDNARAVIAVGIPFPNTRDIQVNLKREYNDKFSKSKGLLTGPEWYEIQAYRALNQALGRCIRHRYDWGAIILVDERYQRASYGNSLNRYVKGLSKWVRSSLRHQPSFDLVVSELKKFSQFMMESSVNKVEKEVKETPDTAKPKFDTPPKFQPKPMGKAAMTNVPRNLQETNVDTAKSKIESIWWLSKENMEVMPLTPIPGSCSANKSPKLAFPVTSTQLTQINEHKNRSDSCSKLELSSCFASTPKSTQKTIAKSKNFPIFESASKKRKKITQIESPNYELEKLEISCVLDTSTEHSHSLVPDTSIGIENKLSYSSDDMFAESEEKKQRENKNSSITKAGGSDRKKKRKKSKKTLNKTLNVTQNEPNTSSTNAVSKTDSDLEDFNLDTSLVGKHQPKSRSKKKRKGVLFCDYE